MEFNYTLLQASSFSYNEDTLFRCPPDEVVEHLSKALDESESYCLRAIFGMPNMSETDLKIINAICIVSQEQKITPLTFMKMMQVDAPLIFVSGFKKIAEAWQYEGILPSEDIPSAEELNQQFEM
jgi:hypothetical protein